MPAWCRVSSRWIFHRFTSNGYASHFTQILMGTAEAVTGLTQKMKTNHFIHFALLDQGEQRRSMTLEAFLGFLRSCPVLESLWIEDAGPTVKKEDIWEVMDTINMPNLRCVRYKSSFPRIAMHAVFTGSLPSLEFQKTRPFT